VIDALDRQLRDLAMAALRRAGALGVLPTPLDAVAAAAGVAEVIDIGSLPEDLLRARPRAMSKILGAYVFGADTAFVDRSLGLGRARFVQAHETAHRLLPWHAQAFLLDDTRRLFRETEEALEREANLLAAHLIFQGGGFVTLAAGRETSLRAARALAREHGASCHATLRHYVEHHRDPVALLAAGRITRRDGTVPIWTATESPAFRRRFGPLAGRIPEHGLCVVGGADLAKLVGTVRLSGRVHREEVGIADRRGELQPFLAEAFRQRSVLVLISPLPAPRSRGAGLALAS